MAGLGDTWSAWGLETSYQYGSGRQGAPPIRIPMGWTCHSRELCQMWGMGQAGGQSGHVFWAEAAFT